MLPHEEYPFLTIIFHELSSLKNTGRNQFENDPVETTEPIKL